VNRAAFALILRIHRGQKGLSQEELGNRAGLHRTFISQLERGLKSPTLDSLFPICDVLGVSVSEFLRVVEAELEKSRNSGGRGT
jgi:transcriptional regulator with XRE-family HTH domain